MNVNDNILYQDESEKINYKVENKNENTNATLKDLEKNQDTKISESLIFNDYKNKSQNPIIVLNEDKLSIDSKHISDQINNKIQINSLSNKVTGDSIYNINNNNYEDKELKSQNLFQSQIVTDSELVD